ncbi:glycosyltransferase family 4 protein [Desulforamulus hydrothermalis]|uniref:Putative undecaprenyl-phosphate N-acetylglucosaminyl 1-phosphate transferase n=1 Tax=Desulforamulus hydrothermalis Lam5 = DSM 18033 TaxID=1121428 RepID=K8E7Y0_9FIRM|nr:MraY family glycosyltransferase [Desulforamulus hydrothermalis]CCO07613.1 putative undecaprenyl-phosphate N-acetylglucosaminyl 1-phosphate transferase [Desulforamulus hydrothermalis Lam5 = DSM 18033]SHH19896.1 UDP-GlcNAc:undecaprenyl-phosphate GlcNAc-1-phosphate transferase [Desulforamulus hydrothermalis Lam5 = DSM 18033]
MLNSLPIAVCLALVIALGVTPLVRRVAFRIGAVDRPDHRKVHSKIMPRLGGLAVFIAFAATVLLFGQLDNRIIGLLTGGCLIIWLGILDDTRGLPAKVKLAGQIAAAAAVVPFGIQVEFITNPFNGHLVQLGVWGVPVTVFWIISVTNAINLIDGLDGLAGGTSFIAALTLAAVTWRQAGLLGGAGLEVVGLALILAASILGFLRHNFYPARIFLGDTGSMFLGYALSVLAVMGVAKAATAISVIIPMVILGIPLLDVFFAILRRYQSHRPIFQPDKEHLHHRMMALGLSHKQTVLAIYAINLVLGISAVILTMLTTSQAVLLLFMLAVAVIVAANKIGVIGKAGRASVAASRTLQQRSSKM